MKTKFLKPEIITWLAGLPDDSPHLEHIEAIRSGEGKNGLGEGKALTITAAAITAGTSRTLVYRAIRAGVLSAFTPYAGANPRITEGELARWLAGRKGRS